MVSPGPLCCYTKKEDTMESKNDDNNRLTFELGLNSGTLTSRSTSIIRVSLKSCGKEKQNTKET